MSTRRLVNGDADMVCRDSNQSTINVPRRPADACPEGPSARLTRPGRLRAAGGDAAVADWQATATSAAAGTEVQASRPASAPLPAVAAQIPGQHPAWYPPHRVPLCLGGRPAKQQPGQPPHRNGRTDTPARRAGPARRREQAVPLGGLLRAVLHGLGQVRVEGHDLPPVISAAGRLRPAFAHTWSEQRGRPQIRRSVSSVRHGPIHRGGGAARPGARAAVRAPVRGRIDHIPHSVADPDR